MIRVQNLLQYPGQEYGQYGQRNPSYYNNANNQYNNYDNNGNGANAGSSNKNNNNNNNFFSNMFSGLFNANGNSNSNNNNDNMANNNNGYSSNINNNNNYNGNYASGYPQSNANIGVGPIQEGVRTVGGMIRPIIDSIFDIPISTLRAVNNLVGRLTGSYQIKLPFQQQQQQQQQQPIQQQQHSPSLPSLPSFPFFGVPTPSLAPSPMYYGIQKSANAQPKSEIEVLKRIRQVDSSSGSNGKAITGTIGNGNQQQQNPPATNASI
ncbi:uncharacterized protein isoform X2 [Musca autumnalis]